MLPAKWQDRFNYIRLSEVLVDRLSLNMRLALGREIRKGRKPEFLLEAARRNDLHFGGEWGIEECVRAYLRSIKAIPKGGRR